MKSNIYFRVACSSEWCFTLTSENIKEEKRPRYLMSIVTSNKSAPSMYIEVLEWASKSTTYDSMSVSWLECFFFRNLLLQTIFTSLVTFRVVIGMGRWSARNRIYRVSLCPLIPYKVMIHTMIQMFICVRQWCLNSPNLMVDVLIHSDCNIVDCLRVFMQKVFHS